VNAGQCAYPGAWPGTTVCYSYDRQEWKRCLDTAWDEATGALTWTHAAESNVVYYAYFAPYSHERHLDLLARCAAAPGVEVRSLGKTLDGRSLDLVELGNPEGSSVWVIHRQHPGESQAEWFAEGLLERLLARSDGLTLDLLKTCRFRIVPSMNPDGAFRGHLRVNAGGANLNREWGPTGDYAAPTLERSPEVLHTLGEMDRVGVDFFIDVHGDEARPPLPPPPPSSSSSSSRRVQRRIAPRRARA
jgi:murein tripeptide amidase MpaA